MARKKSRRNYGDYTVLINGVLYASVNLRQPDGKYKKKYKRVETKLEALQWALEQIENHKTGGLDTSKGLSFADAVRWYKKTYLVKPVFENGIKIEGVKDFERLKTKLDRMSAYFGAKRMDSFSDDDLRMYARYRREIDKVKVATINRDFALLRTLFRRLKKKYKSLEMPEFPINAGAETERDRVMSFAEEKRILAACVAQETIEKTRGEVKYETTIEAKREHLKPIIIFAVDTAMRAGEIFSLTWNDVDFEKGLIMIRSFNSKTERARSVGMTPRVRQILEQLFESNKKGKVFQIKYPYRAFRTACSRAGIKDLNFHDLRHTAITRMIRAGIPHTEVMKISGHRQLSTFMRYLNLVSETVQSNAEQLARYTDDNL